MAITDKEKYLKYDSTEEFILDKYFYTWVLYPNEEQNLFWNSFIDQYPGKSNLIREAALIIKSFQPIEPEVPEYKLNLILHKILNPEKTIILSRYRGVKYAAALAIFLAIGSLIWVSVSKENRFPIQAGIMTGMKGRIILANGSTREFDTEKTSIKQSSSGHLTINNDTLEIKADKSSSDINKVMIPYGKRSEIMLADGTHIWLNSGSQLSYPTEFKSDSREVYLSGEAFFDVKPNPEKPFYVITRDVRIKVLGTSFNVSSYDEDNTCQTVLIKGRVSAGKNQLFAKTIDLIPGERMTYDKKNRSITKDKVDIKFHESWISGYLLFDNEPITEIYKKLERYYNKNIETEKGLDKISFSGKLDLKDRLEDVLENISFASAVKVQERNGSYIIKK